MTGAIYVAGPLDYETRKRVSNKMNYLSPNKKFKKFNSGVFIGRGATGLQIK